MKLPLSDLHLHTDFCDGAASVEEMVLSAIARGFHTVGISGHSPTPFDTRYCMTAPKQYLAECRRVRDKYAGQISVQIGMELDALSGPRPEGLDYVIGSVHYFSADGEYYDVDESAEVQYRALRQLYGGDVHRMIDGYFASVVEMAQRLRPEIVGHFDLLTKFCEIGSPIDPSDGYYRGAALDALGAVIRVAPRLEINSGAVSRGYRTRAYPSDELITETLRLGGTLTLCSDAHSAEQIGFGFAEAAGRLTELGCDTVDVRRGTRFERFDLR